MGITVKLNVEDSVTYVPDIQDNRDAATEGGEVFEVDILPMSGAEYDKLHTEMLGTGKARAVMKNSKKFIKRIVSERVIAVRGFTATAPDGETIEPKTGAELYRVAMLADVATAEMIDDIVLAIKDHSVLEDGELGKLRAQSDSSAPKTHQSETGSASDAETETTILKAPIPRSSSSASELESVRQIESNATAMAKPAPRLASRGTGS